MTDAFEGMKLEAAQAKNTELVSLLQTALGVLIMLAEHAGVDMAEIDLEVNARNSQGGNRTLAKMTGDQFIERCKTACNVDIKHEGAPLSP